MADIILDIARIFVSLATIAIIVHIWHNKQKES